MVFACLLGVLLGAPAPGPFTATRLVRSYTQHLGAPPREVFPLLGPVLERKWAHGEWTPRFVFPAVESDEEGAVFTTARGEEETIWVLSVFDPELLRVEYVQFTPGSRIADLRITLQSEGAESTRAEIRYTWTSLSPGGAAFLEAHRGPVFEKAMQAWEDSMNAYLRGRTR